MSRTKTVAATAATAGAFVAGGVTARVIDNRKRRRRVNLRNNDVPFGSVHSEPLTVVATDGVALRAELEDGPEPTIVFLHGWMLSMDEWHYQRLGLRGKARMVFLDHRGHGSSARPEPGTCTFSQLATDIYTAITQFVPSGPIVLVGHSMGGMAILALAAEYPGLFEERIVGAVLCSTAAGNVLNRSLPAVPLGAIVRSLTPMLDRGRRFNSYSVIKRWGLGRSAAPLHVDMTDEMMMHNSSRTLADFVVNFVDLDLYDALPTLGRIPTTIICGTEDQVTPVRHSHKLAGQMESAEFIAAEGSGHMVVLEHHELVTDAIARMHEAVS